jgi:hypothetical protein
MKTLENWVRAAKTGKLNSVGPHQKPLTEIETELGRVKRLPSASARTSVSFKSICRTCAQAQAFIPPSTVRFAPVMYEASGPATNATIAAISSTRP